ncbi:MAG: hypothetical protein EPN45_07280 [Rhizobiaceae bacterium]|nr:MAG: hypothetical protein EPN45_07280 [Rhizobiaceae bacterium]
MRRLADELPEEADAIHIPDRPEEAQPALWHELYWTAWDAIRFDRPYGAFGGEMPLSYLAVSQYARDHDIAGDAFRIFMRLMSAIDAEWLAYSAEKAKQEKKK